ncbi:MAG TPA: outer membrane protein assembly factor, partial [Granulicella sp.]|nr:outer membrane protein assembly factor [Granulicella sp.]
MTPQTAPQPTGAAPSMGTTNVPLRSGAAPEAKTVAEEPALTTTEWEWQGLIISEVRFEGVLFTPSDPLAVEIRRQVGQPLNPHTVRHSLRRLFATGRYRDIGVSGVRHGDSVTLIFTGAPRYYVGRVEIDGVKDDRLASLLEYSTNLNPGTAFAPSAVPIAADLILQTLTQNGYYQPHVTAKTTADD